MSDAATIQNLLTSARTIAVVGLTNSAWRPAYGVAVYLIQAGYEVIPVGPEREVLGRTAYRDLYAVPVPIDIVDIFRRSERVAPHVDEAIAVGAKAVWLQMGIRDRASEQRAREAGLAVVADRCTKIEHARLVARGLLSA